MLLEKIFKTCFNGIYSIFIGSDINDSEELKDWGNWLFIELKTFSFVRPGDWSMALGSEVEILHPESFSSAQEQTREPLVKFQIRSDGTVVAAEA